MDVVVADAGEACDAGTAERSERADPFVDHGDRDIGLLLVGSGPSIIRYQLTIDVVKR